MVMPFDDRGRFVSRRCPDENCGGVLQVDREEHGHRTWRCDGLTHETDEGPLLACAQWHWDGDPDRRTSSPAVEHE